MNNGAFGEGFPYTNFHDLNMDWIIKIAKDFLDQYSSIQQIITEGEYNLHEIIEKGLDQVEEKTVDLEHRLQAWYDEHSQDISNELATAIQELNTTLGTIESQLDQYAAAKLAQTLESIPTDYTELSNMVTLHKKKIDNILSKIQGLQRNRPATQSIAGTDIFRQGAYMEADGSVVSVHSHNINIIRDRTIKQITFPAMSISITNLPTCVVKYGNDVIASYAWDTSAEHTINMPSKTFDQIYLNVWDAETTPRYTYVDVNYNQGIASIQNLKSGFDIESKPWAIPYGKTVTYKFDDVTELLSGYISTNDPYGGGAHKHMLFPSLGVKTISLSSQATAGIPWAFYYPDLNRSGTAIIGSGAGSSYTFDKPHVGFIGLNRFENNENTYASEFTITYWNYEDIKDDMKYHTSVRKPFNFNGKSAYFIGDSITQGYTGVGTITTENFPKLFSQAVGLNYVTNTSAGSCFTPNLNEVPTLVSKVQNVSTSNPPDFLFIAGGVNDWQLNARFSEFTSALTTMFQWINTNLPNTKIIIITPIKAPEQIWKDAHTQLIGTGRIKNYADRIYETAKRYDNGNYSVVCGFEFGFPDDTSDATYRTAMSGDNLHPTERGYADLYVVGLLNALQ